MICARLEVTIELVAFSSNYQLKLEPVQCDHQLVSARLFMSSLSFSSSHQVTLKTILLFLVSCSLPLVPVSGEGDALKVNSGK